MTVQERIQLSLVVEAIENNKKYSKAMGIVNKSVLKNTNKEAVNTTLKTKRGKAK